MTHAIGTPMTSSNNQGTVPNTNCEVIAVGELLVDHIEMTDEDTSDAMQAVDAAPHVRMGNTLFFQAPGGAPANVAAACATLGVRAGFIGKIGDDERGRFLTEQATEAGIDLTGLVVDPEYTTTAAFAHVDSASGELAYAFDRSPGADTMLRSDELDTAALSAATIVHLGTFSLAAEPSRTATLTAADMARTAGHLVSCDVNLRPQAWPNQSAMLNATATLVERSDLLKVSFAELKLLCPTSKTGDNQADLATETSALLSRGPRFVVVTLGSGGAYLATRTARARVPAFATAHVLDTAGAGDAFWGATLAWLLREGAVCSPAHIDRLTDSDLIACGRFACAAASCSVEKRGALGSAPTASQIAERLGYMPD